MAPMTALPVDTAEFTRYGPHYTGNPGDANYQQRYLMRLPATAKAKGFTRATGFAKTIDDEGGLAPSPTSPNTSPTATYTPPSTTTAHSDSRHEPATDSPE